jgi:MFS family permease
MPTERVAASGAPKRAGLVLISLILVAAVANLNLSVANVALPDIGKSFDSSQTMLDLIAVGYSLGLAASVLWFGALGDRYGRKLMIVLGMSLCVPASLVAGFAPSSGVLFGARVVGGLAAGMAYPTTLALITALWSGPARTKSIALWSALGGGFALLVAARPTFWVAACAGIIVFGSLMGAAYLSQQYLQNVLGYSTIEAGAAIIPAGISMVLVASRRGRPSSSACTARAGRFSADRHSWHSRSC